MKLSEFKNEEAIELLADLIEPSTKIMANPKLANMVRKGKSKPIDIVRIMLKDSPKECLEVLNITEGVKVKDWNIFTITQKLIELISDEDLKSFFFSQSQMNSSENFGSAMENTEEEEQ